MYFIGQDIQAGMILVSIVLTLLLVMKSIYSGVPRLRVVTLCILFLFFWSGTLAISLVERGPSHSLLWDTFGFLSLAGFLYMLFVSLFELYSSPGY